MRSKPPRFLPTLALVALWLAVYFLWVLVRPPEEATVARTRGSTTAPSTATTTPPPLKLKP